MKILVLNYRDMMHPQAGGAEVHLHRIFGRLQKLGNEILLITTRFPGCSDEETVEGIRVKRIGSDLSFQFLIPIYWRRILKSFPADLIVEDINKLPFFTPLFSKLPKLIQIHHLWRYSIFQETSFPLAFMVWLQERMIPWFYRGDAFSAVSPSTVQELVDLGIPSERISLIYNGTEEEWAQYEPQREKQATFLWLGRIRRYKGVWVALEAFRKAHKHQPAMKLIFAGTGPEEVPLRKAVQEWGLQDSVEFKGRVTQEEKRHLLRQSAALIQSSYKEGWGLTVMEAAACGTISLASHVPGLQDSVQDRKTGYLFPVGNASVLAELMCKVLENSELRRSMEQEARHFALGFSWDIASRLTVDRIQSILSASRNR